MSFKRTQLVILSLSLLFTFAIVYSPHLNYRFPFHIDEWHYITESLELGQGAVALFPSGLEIGFYFFLSLLAKLTDLVLIYRFLPAIWAAVSGLILFYVTYKKTNSNFLVAIFSVIFFASIKSNVNITGLWFFTPLSFAIPFIFLYVYLFTEGVEKQNKKLILSSVGLMIFLLPVHAISILFSWPFLFIHLLFNRQFFRKELKFFSVLALVLAAVGVTFYQIIARVPWANIFSSLIVNLAFKKGWGVLELQNYFSEIYSLLGYILAIIGAAAILLSAARHKYLVYLLWPLTVLIAVFIYRLTDLSLLVPYQRNFYYLALSLPFLSAFGLYYLFDLIRKKIINPYWQAITLAALIISAGFFSFQAYYNLPAQTRLYRVIDEKDYQDLLFMAALPPGRVMADPPIATALYPIARQTPIATVRFEDYHAPLIEFSLANGCAAKKSVLDRYRISYLILPAKTDCDWELIYAKNNFIYRLPDW